LIHIRESWKVDVSWIRTIDYVYSDRYYYSFAASTSPFACLTGRASDWCRSVHARLHPTSQPRTIDHIHRAFNSPSSFPPDCITGNVPSTVHDSDTTAVCSRQLRGSTTGKISRPACCYLTDPCPGTMGCRQRSTALEVHF
jgi:hypothetical protein